MSLEGFIFLEVLFKIQNMKKFYITTAIDYVNGSPHLGHCLEKVQADTIARFERLRGRDVFFLTGTDENSLKNVKAAKERKMSVKKFVDMNAKKFYSLKDILNLSFDDFIRTTENRHRIGAQKLWKLCQKDIYKKKYRGLYCVGCEEFYKEEELENGCCPEHKKPLEEVEEENYFFALSSYQEKLKKIIKNDEIEIIPEARKNEVLSFIDKGLEDICISRSIERAKGWGIEVPNDKTQIIWVWFDALSNYLNAISFSKNSNKFKKYWPADVHVIGKGILRFHAIYWPAILLSAKLPLPKKIFVHGYITIEGEKMSKSLGNIVDPFSLAKKYGGEALRYFLLREIPPTEDGDFSEERLKMVYRSDLVGGIGNFTARILAMAEKHRIRKEKVKVKKESLIGKEMVALFKDCETFLENFQFNLALKRIFKFINFSQRLIEKERPWEEGEEKRKLVLILLFSLFNLSQVLSPFLPQTALKIKEQLGVKKDFSFRPSFSFDLNLKGKIILFPKL